VKSVHYKLQEYFGYGPYTNLDMVLTEMKAYEYPLGNTEEVNHFKDLVVKGLSV